MLVACWSAKGGSGTTVVSAALGLLLARRSAAGATLVDLAGDLPAALGLPEPGGPGVVDWLAAPDAGAEALGRLETTVTRRLQLVPRGQGDLPPAGARLVAALTRGVDEGAPFGRVAVADCGPLVSEVALTLASEATLSLLVIRPCYLALRRAVAAPVRPSGVILVGEPARSLRGSDIEDVLGVPVRATVPWDPRIARVVDAGLLGQRMPRPLAASLREAA
jgi:hypothetical protein